VALRGAGGKAVQAAIEDHVRRDPLLRLDYAAVVDPDGMEPKEDLEGRVMLAIAAYLGRTRLIDNILINL
jgi:pantoate--beta-alanine ligase